MIVLQVEKYIRFYVLSPWNQVVNESEATLIFGKMIQKIDMKNGGKGRKKKVV